MSLPKKLHNEFSAIFSTAPYQPDDKLPISNKKRQHDDDTQPIGDKRRPFLSQLPRPKLSVANNCDREVKTHEKLVSSLQIDTPSPRQVVPVETLPTPQTSSGLLANYDSDNDEDQEPSSTPRITTVLPSPFQKLSSMYGPDDSEQPFPVVDSNKLVGPMAPSLELVPQNWILPRGRPQYSVTAPLESIESDMPSESLMAGRPKGKDWEGMDSTNVTSLDASDIIPKDWSSDAVKQVHTKAWKAISTSGNVAAISSRMRSKHHIGWLAAEATEREREHEEMAAHQAAFRRSAQQKYGW